MDVRFAGQAGQARLVRAGGVVRPGRIAGPVLAAAMIIVGTLLFVGLAVGRADPVSPHRLLAELAPPRTAGDDIGVRLATADQAEERALADHAELVRVDSATAKLVDYSRVGEEADGGGRASGREVWAVAVTGEIHPQFDRTGQAYDWAVLFYDPANGVPLSMAAGPGRIPARYGF